MRTVRKRLFPAIAILSFIILLLDTETTVKGASDGIKICLYTLIPSMFPFLILSSILVQALSETHFPFLNKIFCFCGVPKGAEPIFTIGLIGGYPIGAKLVGDAYRQGSMSKRDAERMLGFCNNAGPAFIFGVVSALFSDTTICWIIWLIHIFSAFLTGYILSDSPGIQYRIPAKHNIKNEKLIEDCTRTMAVICAWVIVFRVVIFLLQRWVTHHLPLEIQAMIAGTLELANGCVTLTSVPNIPLRFILCNVMLSLGGTCVFMQTISVAGLPGAGLYIPGKLIQTISSLLISGTVQYFLFPELQLIGSAYWIAALALFAAILAAYKVLLRKNSRFSAIHAV